MTLLEKLLNDQGFINALSDKHNLPHETVISLLSDYHGEIFNTCDITQNMPLYPINITKDFLIILNNNDLSGIKSEYVEIVKQSVKRRTAQLIPYLNKKDRIDIYSEICNDKEFISNFAKIEKTSEEKVKLAIKENLSDILDISIKCQIVNFIDYPYAYKLASSIMNGFPIPMDDSNPEKFKEALDTILKGVKVWILEIFTKRKIEYLDYSMLYEQTTNEYQATIDWLDSLHIHYEVNEDEYHSIIEPKRWDKNTLFGEYESIRFLFDKCTNELLKIRVTA